jgi:hypothetical protein
LNDAELSYDEDDAPEDASEASEAQGVGSEMEAPLELTVEEATTLDRETLEGLDDDEKSELEAETAAAAAAAGPAARPAGVRLSKNFGLAEFHCCRGHCSAASVPSDAVRPLRRLVREVLQPMRDEFGRCDVHSGYRNSAHNAHVEGKPESRHLYHERPGQAAADVSFASGSVDEWARMARRRLKRELGDVGGIGRYHGLGFVHIDLGPKRKWTG